MATFYLRYCIAYPSIMRYKGIDYILTSSIIKSLSFLFTSIVFDFKSVFPLLLLDITLSSTNFTLLESCSSVPRGLESSLESLA